MSNSTQNETIDLVQLFKNNLDINLNKHSFSNKDGFPMSFTIINCQGLFDSNLLSRDILPALEVLIKNMTSENLTVKYLLEHFHVPFLSIVNGKNDLLLKVFSGQTVISFDDSAIILAIETIKKPQRNPEQTNTEIAILGPRDNFIEDIVVNMALIRKRLPTNSLQAREYEVGRRSNRKVRVLYVDDITDKKMLNKLCDSIEKIDIDALLSGNQLMDLVLTKNKLFPKYNYTGRPDFVVQSLMTGRIIILIDTIPYAIITPINLFFLFKAAEDAEVSTFFNSIERLMRLVGLTLAILLPGFWVAITTFHPNQLPLSLLATIVEARRGVPLPTQLEALLMISIFELFREAGLRLPAPVGSTLSVVGGIIIGDAAINAGITSPGMVLVVAGSIVAGFTVFNQALVSTVSILRIFVLICSSFIGFFGFFISLLFIITYMSNIRILGVPYFALVTRANFKNTIVSLSRIPWKFYTDRAKAIAGPDTQRFYLEDDENENN